MRLGAIFVVVCIAVIAASAGAVVHLALGFSPQEALIVAGATLAALVIYNAFSTRLGVRAMVGKQLTDLSRASGDLARQVAELGRRLAALEGRVEHSLDRTRSAIDPLAVEIGELGSLVKQLAETAAAHETALAELGSAKPSAHRAAPVGAAADKVLAETAKLSSPATAAGSTAAPAPTSGTDSATQLEMLASIRGAIDANRIDLYLQPIVTLPQRKVRYYEAMSRLRTEKGDVVPAADFIAQAESAGLMPRIDNLVIFRCVQVVRRLLMKNREIGLFCNLAGSTLTDSAVFQQVLEFMDANRAIAPSLVLEFTQSALRAAGPMENESLAALAERGFRFSLDNVTDLRIEPRELASRGFRFIKVPAALLLNRSGAAATDIHPADMSDLLGRFGIDLIAEKIESEGSVVDLLDCDVRYGQGFLFSPPRPVRAEALQGIAERSDVIARDSVGDDVAGFSGRPGVADEAIGTESKSARTGGLAQLARGGGRI
jgi:cyclic-di-GMP phosphodiesterase TipF (flagellum assembly factor)